MFICASRDTISSTFGFIGWRWDEDQYLRPLTDHILSTSSSPIHDFTFVTNSRFFTLFNQTFSSRSNNDLTKHFPILTWCRDGQLRLIDMDSIFRKIWHHYSRTKIKNIFNPSSNSPVMSKSSSSSSSSNLFRQQSRQSNQTNTNKMIMDVIEDDTTGIGERDLDDDILSEMSAPRIKAKELLENGNELEVLVK